MASVHEQGVGMRARRLALIALAVMMASTVMRAQLIDRVMAVVAGELITLSDVTAALRFGLVPEPPAGQDRLQSALSILIERQLQLTEVNRYLPPEPAAALVDERLAAVRGRFPAQADLDTALAETGLTLAQLRDRVRDDLRIQSYLDQRFGGGLQPTEEDLVRYYRNHEAAFTRAGVLRPFGEVREEVRSQLLAERRVTLVRDWLDGLRRRADVTVLYQPAVPR